MTRDVGKEIGLCRDCRHVRRVESARGSVFHQCGRAREDRDYAPYPDLPVLRCPGYEAKASGAARPVERR